ncbi:MAG: hypothetical protein ACXVLT_09875 [Flavisolibacter sp.]
MKLYTRQVLLLIAVCILIAPRGFAQKNLAATWSPLSLSVGKLTLGTEYLVRKNQSLTFHIGIPVSIHRHFSSNDNDFEVTSKATSVLAGYRLYTGKHEMRGFYFEPYLKYLHNNLEGSFTDNKITPPSLYTTTSTYSAFGVGAQLGVQFLIVKRIILDLFLFGPEANTVKEDGSFEDITNSIPWTAADAQDAVNNIQDAIKNVPFIGKKAVVTADQSSKTVFVIYKGFLPGYRAGFSVGFRF